MGPRTGQLKEEEIIANLINSCCNLFKNPAYSYEEEVRLVKSNRKTDKNILFRESRGLLIPYMEVEIDVSCVSKIIIGPTKHFEDSKKSIHNYLVSSGGYTGNSDIIVKSSVPLRQ